MSSKRVKDDEAKGRKEEGSKKVRMTKGDEEDEVDYAKERRPAADERRREGEGKNSSSSKMKNLDEGNEDERREDEDADSETEAPGVRVERVGEEEVGGERMRTIRKKDRGQRGGRREAKRMRMANEDERLGSEMRPKGVKPREEKKIRLVPIPVRPQAWQVEEHNVKGHVHFEAWCEHCVRGRAQENQHRRCEGHEVREIPNVAIDYCWMGKKDEEIGMPILGGIDEESGSLRISPPNPQVILSSPVLPTRP